jgi:hypothetical protein
MATGNWFLGTDTHIHLTGLKDKDGNFLNAATVTGVLCDTHAVPLPGVSPVTFSYVAASSGNYDGLLPSTVTLKEGRDYDMLVTAVNNGRTMQARIRRKAKRIDV